LGKKYEQSFPRLTNTLSFEFAGIQDTKGDEFTGRMLGAINSMLVEMMAAIARKDYEQRRERQAQGIEKAKPQGSTKGAPLMLICIGA
jgi:DNA invertase Pin-like site-specific DNA recombinase